MHIRTYKTHTEGWLFLETKFFFILFIGADSRERERILEAKRAQEEIRKKSGPSASQRSVSGQFDIDSSLALPLSLISQGPDW